MICVAKTRWGSGPCVGALSGLHLHALHDGGWRHDEMGLSGNGSRARVPAASYSLRLATATKPSLNPPCGAGMASLTIISAIFGVWLGLTFRVFILVPAAVLAVAIMAGSGAANEAGVLWMIAFDAFAIAAMQAGYIGGSAILVTVVD
jgi:hypothetical protein